MATTIKVTRAPDSLPFPQLRPTTKGTLEPRTVGRPILADLPLGVNLLVDMNNVAEATLVGVKVFPHKEKQETYTLAEVYMLTQPVGSTGFGYAGSLGLFRVDFPESESYDAAKHDDEIVAEVLRLLFPGPKAFTPKKR